MESLVIDERLQLPVKPLRHFSHAATMWWVIFNRPEACLANPGGVEKCGATDVFGQPYLDSVAAGVPDPSLIVVNTSAEVGVIYATGGVTDPRNARIRLAAAIYRSPNEVLSFDGQQDLDPMRTGTGLINVDAEVHLVVRDHGRMRRDGLVTQIGNFLEPYCSDPLLGHEGGRNRCADIQAAVFAQGETGLDAVLRLADGLPLSYSTAHLYRQGDVIQAIIDTRIPDRRNQFFIQGSP
ncbi:MAG: hypothetical protein AAFY29_22060 [Pseudomonadota bacterium]